MLSLADDEVIVGLVLFASGNDTLVGSMPAPRTLWMIGRPASLGDAGTKVLAER